MVPLASDRRLSAIHYRSDVAAWDQVPRLTTDSAIVLVRRLFGEHVATLEWAELDLSLDSVQVRGLGVEETSAEIRRAVPQCFLILGAFKIRSTDEPA